MICLFILFFKFRIFIQIALFFVQIFFNYYIMFVLVAMLFFYSYMRFVWVWLIHVDVIAQHSSFPTIEIYYFKFFTDNVDDFYSFVCLCILLFGSITNYQHFNWHRALIYLYIFTSIVVCSLGFILRCALWIMPEIILYLTHFIDFYARYLVKLVVSFDVNYSPGCQILRISTLLYY